LMINSISGIFVSPSILRPTCITNSQQTNEKSLISKTNQSGCGWWRIDNHWLTSNDTERGLLQCTTYVELAWLFSQQIGRAQKEKSYARCNNLLFYQYLVNFRKSKFIFYLKLYLK
jgi:hypothetical protein